MSSTTLHRSQITVFKSRTEVAMLQAQDQASRLEAELEATKKKYDAVRPVGPAVQDRPQHYRQRSTVEPAA